jgi:hypothetical protein
VRLILVFVLSLSITLAIFYFAKQPHDPIYKGKRLSAHLLQGSPTKGSPTQPLSFSTILNAAFSRRFASPEFAIRHAREPLTNLGPASIPLLEHWLDAPKSRFQSRLEEFAVRRNLPWERFYVDRQQIAFSALFMISSNAAQVTPKLVRFVHQGNDVQRRNAIELLSRILETASETDRKWTATQCRVLFDSMLKEGNTRDVATLWLLAHLSQNYSESDKENLLRHIVSLQDKAPWGIERLIDRHGLLRNLLHLESTNDAPKVGAAMLFTENPILAERVVPLLSQALLSSNRSLLERSAYALGQYGSDAKPALPFLSNLVNHPRPAVAKAVLAAIKKIEQANE